MKIVRKFAGINKIEIALMESGAPLEKGIVDAMEEILYELCWTYPGSG